MGVGGGGEERGVGGGTVAGWGGGSLFNDTATTEIYTLSLHDALSILLLLPVTLADLGEIMWKQATTLRGYFLFLM